MARSEKSSRKTSSFGKRSDAEKSFHHRKKEEKRFDSERPKKSFSSGRDEKPRSFGSARPTRFGNSEGGEKKPYGRRDDSSSERPKRFSKPFEKRAEGSDRPFNRSGSKPFGERRSFDAGSEKPKRFSKGPFEKRDEGKSFGDRKERFDSDKPRFSKEGGEKRPFRKEPPSFGSGEPRKFSKPFERRDDEKPFRKSKYEADAKPNSNREGDDSKAPRRSSRPFDTNEERPKKFSRTDVVKKSFKTDERKPFGASKDGAAPDRPEYKEKARGEGELIRLNKFMANSGVGSRREADEFIKMGLVTVNGTTVTEMGHKVKMTDEVRYEGKRLKAEKPVYVLLNKPKGFITTTDDPQERNTVMNLVANAGKERIYPVGRLDRNTTGLLLLTNDGDLADKLTHPSYKAKKIYKAALDKPITKADFQKIQEGVYLEEGRAVVDDLAMVDEMTVGIELHIGWNRIVRRIFEALGYEVLKLDRVVYAGLDKKDLGRGQWRFLKPEEVVKLKHFGS
jgi:23S rRNA pseudouridine2605 synthase